MSQRAGLTVAIVGCGLIGAKRAEALAPHDRLLACFDLDPKASAGLARRHGAAMCPTLEELFGHNPDVVVVATVHDQLAALTERALDAGAHVLVEKPAGISSAQIEALIECQRTTGRQVKVGFNHRFHPGIARIAEEVHAGHHGELLFVRARYGHGGRPGYDREWRAVRERSGGGELIDQGMHLLDLCNWLAGPLPVHSALLRTQFWDAQVEDNAALMLGEARSHSDTWAMLHVSWTEWKNTFSLEACCLTAKLQLDGLAGSYGPQRLRIYRMAPQLGPPELEEIAYPEEDRSWKDEWEHLAVAIAADDRRPLLGDLRCARNAWQQVEAAYAMGGHPSPSAGSVDAREHVVRGPAGVSGLGVRHAAIRSFRR